MKKFQLRAVFDVGKLKSVASFGEENVVYGSGFKKTRQYSYLYVVGLVTRLKITATKKKNFEESVCILVRR